jgi:hypothetical protein
MSAILASVVKMIAEGRFPVFGPRLKVLYWWLAGKKTWTSAGLYTAWLTLYGLCKGESLPPEIVALGCQWEGYVLSAANVLLAIGLFDAAVRLEPPKK